VDTLGFPALLLMNVVSLTIVVIALWVSYRDPYRGDQEAPILRMAWESVGIIWHSLRLRALFPALFLLFGGWMMAFTYVPLAIAEIYTGNEPGTAIGLVIGASGLTTLILSPILGALSDKFGGWRVLFIGAGISVLLWPLPYLTQGLVPFAILWSILNGLVSAVFAISFNVLSNSTTDEVRGRVMSFAYMPVNFGFILGPAIGTWITQSNIFNVFPAAAVLSFLGVLALVYAYRQPAQSKGATLESV
jgi:DHA1 family multidrug resistance protein-like MFS transporter